MGKPEQIRNTITRQIATAALPYNTSQPSKASITQDLPSGNLSLLSLKLGWRGDLDLATSSAGSIVTDGEKIHLRDLYLDTDQHGPIVSGGMDGLMLERINRVRNRTAPTSTAIAAATTGNPTFAATAMIPLAHRDLFRPYDASFWMGKAAMRLYAQMGIVTDFISGGTYTTENVRNNTLDVTAGVLQDPVPATIDPATGKIVDFGEDPIFMPCYDVAKVDVKTGQMQIALPVRDRIYSRIYVWQRNSSTLAEISNAIAATANVSLVLNGQNWFGPSTLFQDIRDRNKDDYAIETLPAGMMVLDLGGNTGRINNMLSVIDPNNQQLYLNIDGTAQTNAQLWIAIESYKPIPQAARR